MLCLLPASVETAREPPGAQVTPAMTPGASSEPPAVVTGSAPQNGENKPPQAIVKPHVLTHVIEGFVIQEGAEPFPVSIQSWGCEPDANKCRLQLYIWWWH